MAARLNSAQQRLDYWAQRREAAQSRLAVAQQRLNGLSSSTTTSTLTAPTSTYTKPREFNAGDGVTRRAHSPVRSLASNGYGAAKSTAGASSSGAPSTSAYSRGYYSGYKDYLGKGSAAGSTASTATGRITANNVSDVLKQQQSSYYTNKTSTLLTQLREQRAHREDTWSALSPRSRARATADKGATGTLASGRPSTAPSSSGGAAAYKPLGYKPAAAYKSHITVNKEAGKTANSRGRYGYGYRETDHGYGYKKMPRTGSYVYRTLSPATAEASNAQHPPRTQSELEFVKLAAGFDLPDQPGSTTPTVHEEHASDFGSP